VTAEPGTPAAAAAAADGRAAVPPGDAATRDDTPSRSPRVVFCGGCNPHIDRGVVATELAASSAGGAASDAAAGGGERDTERSPDCARPTVYLSGCPRACASGHRLTGDEPGDVVVAGEAVDGRPTPFDEIAATIRQKLKE